MFALLGDLAAGCETERVRLRYGTCAVCVADLEALVPHPAAPTPPPPGFPACAAVGPYAGPLRGALLAYKEKGRHRLARPLGTLLAGAVAALAPRDRPVVLIPVPSTAAARRQRHGDHMARMTGHAVRRLRAAGWTAGMVQPLRALPRPDSTSLDAAGRHAAAVNSLRINPRISVRRRGDRMRGTLVVTDDIVTTGATLAAVVRRLEEADMQVTGAAVLAATQLRKITPRI
ncbi:putative amidophosphoribosyltransferase [Actinoplanes lutulentus]|uniref:Putative amidophosphoribosyltransferase n=1 Tax=Actinoplanes lutulentus TaxID=1287878 RepID=A0A327ZG00_9ACTN|nr:phosphoribosyltransferase family protein [Actinoplanes lutulentus]RAK40245.1 putative amidophosphoribosyltransferase [Actinoplanes lutulentus]